MSVSEYKLQVFREIMDIEDELKLKQIYHMVHRFLTDLNDEEDDKEEPQEKISFEEWNEQFEGDMDLDTYIPEHGCTLREFRMSIYEAEMDDDEMTMEELTESMKTW